MSPQMQQNIGLLLLPALDIQELIESSLEENIMLELDELQLNQVTDKASLSNASEESVAANTDNPMDLDQTNIVSDTEWGDRQITRESDVPTNFEYSHNTDDISSYSGKTLTDHLLWQLEIESLNTKKMIIGRVVIDAIDDNGYLQDSIEDILKTLSVMSF